MNAARLTAATGASAVATLGIQVLALLSLNTTDFGLFSVMYLAAAFGLSLQLSAISEAWVRSHEDGQEAAWRIFSATTLYFALGYGVAAILLALAIPGLRSVWWLAGIAVAASIYRAGARFHSLRESDWRRVLPADVIGAVGSVIAACAVLSHWRGDLFAVMVAWAATSLMQALTSRCPDFLAPTVIRTWVRHYGDTARPLLRDSIVMDAAAIGTPYALIPMIGISSFGVYRAVSNVAAPVRLLLNPLRPRLASISDQALRRRKSLLVIATLSAFTGALTAGSLAFIAETDWDLGTLGALTDYALPTGVFVAANMFGHTYYLFARQRATGARMLRGRFVQTILAIGLPLLGALSGGLAGAIWAYAVATVGSALTWAILVLRRY